MSTAWRRAVAVRVWKLSDGSTILDRTLRGIPRRSIRAVVGGFNTHLGPELAPPHILGRGYDVLENDNGIFFDVWLWNMICWC